MLSKDYLANPFWRFAFAALITAQLSAIVGAPRWIIVALALAATTAAGRIFIVNEIEWRKEGQRPFSYLFDEDDHF